MFTDDESAKRPLAFTDSDLKRFHNNIVHETEPYMYRIHKDELKALIARLESAERVGLYAIDAPSCRYCVDNAIKSHNNECPFLKDLKAWRKSKGDL